MDFILEINAAAIKLLCTNFLWVTSLVKVHARSNKMANPEQIKKKKICTEKCLFFFKPLLSSIEFSTLINYVLSRVSLRGLLLKIDLHKSLEK